MRWSETVCRLALVVLVALFSGCGTLTPAIQPPGAAAIQAESTAVIATTAGVNGNGDSDKYLIHAGDSLNIQVRGEEDLSGDFRVSSEGVIIYSFLGRMAVAGLSAPMVESNLTAILARDYLVNPKVYVQVRSSVMRRVILLGEVRTPGVYDIPVGERFTLLQVIAKAGGLTDLAATDRVRIVRRSGAVEKVLKVNVTDLLYGRGESRDVELESNDVVTIPQTIF